MGNKVEKNKVIERLYLEQLNEETDKQYVLKMSINQLYTDEIWLLIDINGVEIELDEKLLRGFNERLTEILKNKTHQ